jgi:hypothetical protein
MTQQSSSRYLRWFLLSQVLCAAPLAPAFAQVQLPTNFISSEVPHDVPTGSAASIQDLAIFAWREFIALNWPAIDPTTTGLRGRPDNGADFLSVKKDTGGSFPLLVWHTYRHKNELFPADGKTDATFDSKAPVYKYKLPGPLAPPFPPGTLSPGSPGDTLSLFNNLDETTQIGLCTMYAHNNIRIAYEAKVNRGMFDYANAAKLTACDDKGHCPTLFTARVNTKNNLVQYGGICTAPVGTTTITLPCGDATVAGDAGEGAIEVKAAWRPLTPTEASSGRFFVRKVIFYSASQKPYDRLYENAVWGLVALHIIHKTKSFPTFVFASWEQVDNYDDINNKNPENLRFHNILGQPMPPPDIPVTRAHPIHSQIPPVNDAVHAAFKAKEPGTIWQYYKLIGVQGPPVNGPPPANSPIDDLSYYYLANIVVETNQALQNFFGKVGDDGYPAKQPNVFLNGKSVQMGGCQGCHGFQGQTGGGDMSRLMAVAPGNSTQAPEIIQLDDEHAVASFRERSRDEAR